jgi:mitogen-activated protein kinase 1/3
MASDYIKSLPPYEKKKTSEMFDYCLPEWEDFLDKTLLFDPRKRMTIDEALKHPLFDEIRDAKDMKF